MLSDDIKDVIDFNGEPFDKGIAIFKKDGATITVSENITPIEILQSVEFFEPNDDDFTEAMEIIVDMFLGRLDFNDISDERRQSEINYIIGILTKARDDYWSDRERRSENGNP